MPTGEEVTCPGQVEVQEGAAEGVGELTMVVVLAEETPAACHRVLELLIFLPWEEQNLQTCPNLRQNLRRCPAMGQKLRALLRRMASLQRLMRLQELAIPVRPGGLRMSQRRAGLIKSRMQAEWQ